MLTAGTFVPVVGNSDTHNEGQTVGQAQTVYRLATLSTEAVLDAIRGGHCWIAESAGVDLTFTARVGEDPVAECGDTVTTASGTTVTVTLAATGVAGSLARILGAAGVLAFGVADDSGAVALTVDVPADTTPFVRAEIGRPEVPTDPPSQNTVITEMAALTNPIFVVTG
jgi:hypothetical protein